jgi:hypothetical protein
MTNKLTCSECGRLFNLRKDGNCPNCGYLPKPVEKPVLSWNEFPTAGENSIEARDRKPISLEPNSDLSTLLNENVEATNRTTHAVRAFVSYFAAFMITGLVGMLIWMLGAFALTTSDDPVLTMTVTSILILLVAIAGTAVALVWFFKEWALSRVPKR